jgi:hypothetical protein
LPIVVRIDEALLEAVGGVELVGDAGSLARVQGRCKRRELGAQRQSAGRVAVPR